MYNKNIWLDFVRSKKSVLLLLVVSLVGSALYAVYLKAKQQLDLGYIEQYLADSQLTVAISMEHVIKVFWSYLKRYLVIWLIGMVSCLLPLALAIVFLDIFAYGFSVTAMYLVYGVEGVLVAGHLFVIQGILMTMLLLELMDCILKKYQIFNRDTVGKYGSYLLEAGIGCLLISLIEVGIMNYL